MGNIAPTETVLAAATGSAGGLGKVADVLATSGKLLVRCPNTGFGRTDDIDWRVKCSQVYTVQKYRSRNISDLSATLTLASFTDADTIVLNGLTITGESTATDALFGSRKFSTAGGTDTLDAVELAKLINADYAVLVDGSVTAGDYLSFVTDEGTKRITAVNDATPDITLGYWDMSGNQAAELASLVLAINHSQNVTFATATAGDTVVINGLTFTGHATTTTAANREWDIADDATAAAGLVTCVNDATYGVPGVTASATGAQVFLYRDSQADSITLSSSDGTRLARVTTVGGIPGVTAVATGATGELSITPTWTRTLTVADYASAGGATTHITTTDIDVPGVYATSADAVVTLVPGTPASQSEGELATVIQATAAARCTCAQVMTGLVIDGDVVPATSTHAANSTTSNGRIYNQDTKGWPQAYIQVINGAGSDATVTVAAIKN